MGGPGGFLYRSAVWAEGHPLRILQPQRYGGSCLRWEGLAPEWTATLVPSAWRCSWAGYVSATAAGEQGSWLTTLGFEPCSWCPSRSTTSGHK